MSCYLNQMNDISQLVLEKEKIKEQIMQPDIHWQSRMELYAKIRNINERIHQLNFTQQVL